MSEAIAVTEKAGVSSAPSVSSVGKNQQVNDPYNVYCPVSGRVREVIPVTHRDSDRPLYRYVIVKPAPDEYTYPNQYCVLSDGNRFASVGDDVNVIARVTCKRNRSQNTGEYYYTHYLWYVRG